MKRHVILTVFSLSLLIPAFSAASQHRQGRHRSADCLYQQDAQEIFHPRIQRDLPPYGWRERGDRMCRRTLDTGGTDRNFRDADGDGIPNGRDRDFTRAFADENRDGICDHRWNPGNDAKKPE